MKILFVCTGNSFRSPVAEALLKKLRGDFEVESAGTYPAGMIAPNAKKFLERENALENLKRMPEGIDQKKVEEYDLIIVMDETHKSEILKRYPQTENRVKVWNIDDPIHLPEGADMEVYNEIKRKVKELAESVQDEKV